LADGDTQSPNAEEYQTSKADINLGDEKYQNLTTRIRQLRKFGRDYLSTTSVLSILPTGIHTKDIDMTVKVAKRTEDGFRLTNGK